MSDLISLENKKIKNSLFINEDLYKGACVKIKNSNKTFQVIGINNVSIESIVQLDASDDKAEIVVITHEVNNGDFEKSKDEINSLNEVKSIASQLSCI